MVQYDDKETAEKAGRATDPDQSQASVEQLLRGVLYEDFQTRTPFDEILTARWQTIFSLKPTWGTSKLRDRTSTTGTGASVSETSGELEVTAGTDASGESWIQTVERGQYVAGTSAQAGVGLRLSALPTDDQNVEWGYFAPNGESGFIWGHDATSLYINRLRDGSDNIIRRSAWDDPLDGTGPSGYSIDPTTGLVWQVDYVWYGYGSIEFSVLVQTETGRKERVVAHTINISGGNTIIDPNQPITVRVSNGGSVPGAAISAYIGGRQFAVARETEFQKRTVPGFLDSYTLTAAQDVWEPVVAVREKSTFGPSGRANSTRTSLRGVRVNANQNVDIKIEAATDVTATFGDAEGWDSNETSVEFSLASDGSITIDNSGLPVLRDIIRDVTTAPSSGRRFEKDAEIILLNSLAAVVYVKPKTAQTTEVSVILDIEERW